MKKEVLQLMFLCVAMFVAGCASGIKGEKGEAGKDGQNVSAGTVINRQDMFMTVVTGMKRPGFRAGEAGSSTVVVPATSAKPAKLLIGGTAYANTADASCDLTVSGRGGVDYQNVTANTIYYLYGVPSAGGTAFDLIASAQDPSRGPVEQAAWSYIGAFSTLADGTVAKFSSSQGKYITSALLDSRGHTGDTNLTAVAVRHPVTAKIAVGNLEIFGNKTGLENGVNESGLVNGFNDPAHTSQRVTLQTPGVAVDGYFEVALENPTTIYLQTTNPDNTVFWEVYGWIEDPAEWP